jgi:hypothetical protein
MDAKKSVEQLLEMYETRLRFVDVYDALVEKLTVFVEEAIQEERSKAATPETPTEKYWNGFGS